MRTFTQLQTYIQQIFNDTSTATQTVIQGLINDYHKDCLNYTNWPSSRGTKSYTSVGSQQGYSLPVDYRQSIYLKAVTGGNTYYPKLLSNEDEWNTLNAGNTSETSNIPIYAFLDGIKFYLYPTPASTAVTYTLGYDKRVRDLTSADFSDYSTGTVAITNGGTTVTGSGTTFASTMVNRFIRADSDGFWYRISAYTDATHVTIKAFEGATISGSNFLIGTLPFGVGGDNVIPEEAWKPIAFGVLMELFERREDMSAQGGRAKYFERKYKDSLEALRKEALRMYASPTVENIGLSRQILNPQDFPSGINQ